MEDAASAVLNYLHGGGGRENLSSRAAAWKGHAGGSWRRCCSGSPPPQHWSAAPPTPRGGVGHRGNSTRPPCPIRRLCKVGGSGSLLPSGGSPFCLQGPKQDGLAGSQAWLPDVRRASAVRDSLHTQRGPLGAKRL